MKESLRLQLFLKVFLGLGIITISMSYTFYSSMKIQAIVNNQFQKEQFYQKLQYEISEIREPLLDYLSSRSSKALAALLIKEQTLRNMIPEEMPIYSSSYCLSEREIFFMLSSYLDMIEDAINLKRGRAINEYTKIYEDMDMMNTHIANKIDVISLSGIRERLTAYESVLEASRILQFRNLLTIIFAFLFSMTWMLFSISKVTTPMHRLAQMAEELSGGNFDIPDIHTVISHRGQCRGRSVQQHEE